ncbi:MAG: hypothetical protein AAGC83_09005, partial [Pseudomonadota bacterium]
MLEEESLSDFIAGEPPSAAGGEPVPGAPEAPEAAGDHDPMPEEPPLLWEDRIAFDPKQRASEFDTSFADGYVGSHEASLGSDVVVMVGKGKMPLRLDVARSMRGVDKSLIMPVLDFGPVHSPKNGQPVPAICYTRPKGDHLVEATEIPFAPMRDDAIIQEVITPVAQGLTDLLSRRVFHGRINPANLIRRDAATGPVVLGDCLCGPPGYDQPLAFETIARCMADPVGRGAGLVSDDLYALGVTIAVLCMGVDPMAQFPPEMIIEQKMARGSYTALVGQRRLPSKLLEPVRGLLADDVEGRWTLDELNLWLSGRRLSPKQATTPARASRPLRIGDRNHSTVPELADGLVRDVAVSVNLLDNGHIDTWIRRTIGSDALADAVLAASEGGSSRGFREERRVARIAMVLDPNGPIRYRGKALTPDGIGWSMAEAISKGRSISEISDFIESGLASAWFLTLGDGRPDKAAQAKAFERHRAHLNNAGLGYGVERVLYDLMPDMPCLSPLLDDYYIMELSDLVRALDQIAGRAERPAEPIDQHIIAFILSRNSRVSSIAIREIASPSDQSSRCLAMLSLFADLQSKTGINALPNLASWMVSHLEPLLDELHSQKLRNQVKEALVESANHGSLVTMLAAAKNKGIAEGDQKAFEAARKEYWLNEEVAQRRELELANCRDVSMFLGHQYAAVVAGLFALAALATV